MTADDVLVLYDRATNLLEVTGLTNAQTGEPIADAEIKVTVTDMGGTAVTGNEVTWPMDVPPVAGKPGDYRVALTLDLAEESYYRAELAIDAGAALKDFRRPDLKCVVRGAR